MNTQKASHEETQARTGVHLVGLAVAREMKWIFREKTTSDIGIDGEIEVQASGQSSHGRLIAAQIKCGPSYLKEKTASEYIFRGDYAHLRYWANYSVPVLVILCDPDSQLCWWREVNISAVEFHEKGWNIRVPFSNILSVASCEMLKKVAARLQKKDLIELTLRDWLGWSFRHRMKLVSDLLMPRDYHWFSHLGVIDKDFYMVDYLVAVVSGFDNVDIGEMLRHAAGNHREYSYRNFLLAFVSESLVHLTQIPSPPVIAGLTIQYVPLLLAYDDGPRLLEVGKSGGCISVDDYDFCDYWAGNSVEALNSCRLISSG